MIAANELLTLFDAFPYALDGAGIFFSLQGLSFNPNETTSNYLDFDYFGNYSGDKIASKLIHRLWDETKSELPNTAINKLAGAIRARFTSKWETLWGEYSSPWFKNVDLEEISSETGTSSENTSTNIDDKTTTDKSNSKTDTLEHNTKDVESTTNTQERTHSGGYKDVTSGTDSSTVTRTGSVDTTESGNTSQSENQTGTRETTTSHSGTVSDTGSTDGLSSNFGFNTVGNEGNPYQSEKATDSNTRTFGNADTTTETPNLTASTTGTRTNTKSEAYKNVSDAQSGTLSNTTERTYNNDKESDTGSGNRNITRTGTDTRTITDIGSDINIRKGTTTGTKSGNSLLTTTNRLVGIDYRRQNKVEMLIQLFTNPNIFPFFEIVYGDIDSILAVPIFKST